MVILRIFSKEENRKIYNKNVQNVLHKIFSEFGNNLKLNTELIFKILIILKIMYIIKNNIINNKISLFYKQIIYIKNICP